MALDLKDKRRFDEWEVTCLRHVAYIDIMGFKDRVARSTHEEVYEMMKRIKSRKQFAEKFGEYGENANYIKSTTYSDSIMIYSKDSTREALAVFIAAVSIFTEGLFLEGVPHKGAVAFGKITLDTKDSIFFGQPLIDAFLLQEELNFYGVVIHGSSELEIDKYVPLHFLNVHEYLCPLKGNSTKHLTICPFSTKFINYGFTEDLKQFHQNAINLFKTINDLKYSTSGQIRRYIDNTITYVEEIAEREKKLLNTVK